MTYCTECGTPHKPSRRFCTGCGKQVRTPSSTPVATTSMPSTSDISDVAVPLREPDAATSESSTTSSAWPEAAPPSSVEHDGWTIDPPTRPHQRNSIVAALTVLVLVLVLGIGVAAWVTLNDSAVSVTSSSTSAAQPPTPPQTETSTVQTTEPPPNIDPQSAALNQLTRQILRDRPEVQARLAEAWVPQLSSKQPGTQDNGIVYNYTDTVNDHLAWRARYNARLVWSGDWSSFEKKNYYVTVAMAPFSTPTEANAWCDSQGIDRENCFAKQLSIIVGPDGSTVNR